MSEAETATRPVVENTVAANTAVEKRSLQMKQFRDKEALKKCIDEQRAIALGQIIGHAFEVKMKEGQTPDGQKTISPFIIGDFEAVNYKTGEIMSASGAYLPKYFAETIQAALTKGAGASHGIAFAIEIVVEPTGKQMGEGIQYAYGVKRLIERRPDSPLEQMKAQLAAAGTLRLPKPKASPQAALESDLPEPEDVIDGDAIEGADAAEPAAEAVKTEGKGKSARK